MRHLPSEAKFELIPRTFVCHHQESNWNGVSSGRLVGKLPFELTSVALME